MFPLVHFYVSHKCLLSKNLPLWRQSMNYFIQSIRNVSNNFHSLIGFFWVNWNHIFTLVIFLFSKVFRFHTYSILIIITMMTLSLKFLELRNKISLFPMQEHGMQAIFVLLCKKSFLCLSLKCFLKGPVKIWHIKTTVGYLCTLQVPQIFPIFTKLL